MNHKKKLTVVKDDELFSPKMLIENVTESHVHKSSNKNNL